MSTHLSPDYEANVYATADAALREYALASWAVIEASFSKTGATPEVYAAFDAAEKKAMLATIDGRAIVGLSTNVAA